NFFVQEVQNFCALAILEHRSGRLGSKISGFDNWPGGRRRGLYRQHRPKTPRLRSIPPSGTVAYWRLLDQRMQSLDCSLTALHGNKQIYRMRGQNIFVDDDFVLLQNLNRLKWQR